jgi:hypothetical protein
MMHGFLYRDGTYTTVNYALAGTGPMQGTGLLGINNLGVLTGIYVDSKGTDHAFLDIAGRFVIVNNSNAGTKKLQGTEFYGLNDLGVITGAYFDTSGLCHGFIYAAGTFIPVNVPGSTTEVANVYVAFGPTDINNAGVVVGGYYNSKGVENGFSLTPGH